MIGPSRDDILSLGSTNSERLIQLILWNYADRNGFGKNVVSAFEEKIVVPAVSRTTKENSKDGGLELTVVLPKSVNLAAPFLNHRSIFQVKATSEPLSKLQIKKEVSKDRVKKFLENGGHYVLVYTKVVPTYGEHDSTWNDTQYEVLKKALAENFPGKSVTGEIWTPDDIGKLIQSAPQTWSVFPRSDIFTVLSSQTLLSRMERKEFAPAGFDIPFAKGGVREEQLESLKKVLAGFNGYFEIRGNMGIGKSRLVYEAVNSLDRNATTVWFTTRPSDPSYITHCQGLLHAHSDATIRIVADECEDDISNQLKTLSNSFKDRVSILVIIPYRGRDATTYETDDVAIVDKMTSEDLSEILKTFNLETEVKAWIIEICDGYPKLARVLAENVRKRTDRFSKEELIQWLATNKVFRDETVAGQGWVNLILDDDDLKVLGVLSLLTEVGHSGPRANEYKQLCDFFNLDQEVVEKVIHKNIQKGFLSEGANYIYVTPLILASHLCSYKLIGLRSENFEKLIILLKTFPRAHLGKSAMESFSERLKLSSLNSDVQKKFSKVLESFGPFDQAVLQSEEVAELAFACSYSQPMFFLEKFVSSLKTRNIDEIMTWTKGRRKTVRFLEKAVFYPELFEIASEGLYLLSRAENESWANNATGIWHRLFSPLLSASMAPILLRTNVLLKLAASGADEGLINKAFNSFLSFAGGSRSSNQNKLGLPVIATEVKVEWEEYHNAITEFVGAAKKIKDRKKIVRQLIDHLRQLVMGQYINRHSELIDWFYEESKDDVVLQQRLLLACDHILNWESERLEPPIKEKIKSLYENLQKQDLESSVRRWSFAPLINDLGKMDLYEAGVSAVIDRILKDKALEKVKSILVNPEATRADSFMFQFGKSDKGHLAWEIIKGWNNDEVEQRLQYQYLVGRFYGGEDHAWVDAQFDDLSKESKNIESIFISSKDTETERSFQRMLELAKNNPELIRHLVYGGRAGRLTSVQLGDLILFFDKINDKSKVWPIWDVLGQFVHDKSDKPLPLSKERIELLIDWLAAPVQGTMTEHYQDEALKVLMKHHIDLNIARKLSEKLLAVMLDDAVDYNFSRRCGDLLKLIAEQYTDQVFKVIFEKLKSSDGLMLFRIEHILDEWAYYVFKDKIEAEVKRCDEKTAEFLARFTPDSYGALNTTTATLIKRFPKNAEIQSALVRAFFSGSFTGPIKQHYNSQIEVLDSWAEKNELSNLDIVISVRSSLSKQYENAEKEEHEQDFLNKTNR